MSPHSDSPILHHVLTFMPSATLVLYCSIEQRTFAMLISFFTFGIFAAYAPYEDADNDLLALMCQAIIFIVFLCAAILQNQPGSPVIDLSQTALLCLVLLSLFVFELFKASPGGNDKQSAFTKVARRAQARAVRALDACIGLKMATALPSTEPPSEEHEVLTA